ncbi:hypothetical protein [uncultured Fretibacterium sp.]|uniref:hypothetical protein n=1 Tax=uncultured Fretibacterium sp. TaxID=1678694 RepID=UPI003447BC50
MASGIGRYRVSEKSGRRSWVDRASARRVSEMIPSEMKISPSLFPEVFCNCSAWASCSFVMAPA